ncbi:MAG TPA: HmuY family protein [Fodinibius sp.]|nr:HmuY family protein [Fodinibius sp.]
MKDMTIKQLSLPLLAAAFTLLFTGCSDDTTGPGEIEAQLEVHTVKDLPADTDATPGSVSANFTFYNLRDNSIVADEDSASTQWDLAFSGTTILTNSGVSGPGEGGAVVLDQSFKATTMAPSEGLSVDTDSLLAIPTGRGNGWYNYDMEAHVVRPISDKTIVIRTADGEHYAKLKILNYYKGNPDMTSQEFQNDPPPSRYYTFEYAIQMDGSRDLN